MRSCSHTIRARRAFAGVFRQTRERRRVSLALASVAAVCGLLAFDAPSSRAWAGLFDDFFGGGGYGYEDYGYSRRGHGEYGSSGQRRHKSRSARHGGAAARQKLIARANEQASGSRGFLSTPTSQRTVCVRACDGYVFGASGAYGGYDGASREAACAAACPDAETQLFVLAPGAEDAAKATNARGGESYSQYLAKFRDRENKPASCGCHVASTPASEDKALLSDPTLRYGDLIVTTKGVQVYRGGGGALPHKTSDFLSLAETSAVAPAHRGALAAIDKMLKLRPATAPVDPERRTHGDAGE